MFVALLESMWHCRRPDDGGLRGGIKRREKIDGVELGDETEAGRVAAAIARRRTSEPFRSADDLGRVVAGVKTQRRRGSDPAP